jgi:ketosteroid isomerase-like protein
MGILEADMSAASPGDRLLRLFAAIREGDVDRLAPAVDSETSLEVPGRSRLAGTHRGPQGLSEYLRTRRQGLDEFEAFGEDLALSEDHAVLLYAVRARRGAERVTSHEALVAHSQDGRLAEMFLYVFDQAAFDRFWA